MKKGMWTAYDHKGKPIVSVLADSKAGAVAEVEKELNKNWSRRAYLAYWNKGGKTVRKMLA